MKIRIEKEQTLLEALAEAFPQSSKTHLKKIIKYGFVSQDDAILRLPELKMEAGRTIEYKKYDGKEAKKEKAPFRVIFEDESVIAVLKPAGVLSVGGANERSPSMYKQVLDFFAKQDGHIKIRMVHRLDREVSGILLLAKTEKAKHELIEYWDHNVKRYWALVEGRPEPSVGRIESWLVEGAQQKMQSFEQPPHRHPDDERAEPKWSVTRYKTLSDEGPNTLLEIELETGRKNQIRVHLSSIGHPIIGDRKYGADPRFIRQVRLHAFALSFRHPLSKEMIDLEITMPKGFLTLRDFDEKY